MQRSLTIRIATSPRNILKKLSICLIVALSLTGCAVKRSIPIEYRQGVVAKIPVTNTSPVGVPKWKDDRPIVVSESEIAEKTLFRNGPATIGITYKGQDYYRIADFVRDSFIQELAAQGANVKSIDTLPSTNNFGVLGNIAKSNGVDYVIGGDLNSLDFACSGAWTLECSRKANITLSMVDKDGKPAITREPFAGTMSNNEGIAVTYETAIQQLTGDVLKQALEKAINRTIEILNQSKK